MPDHSFQTIYFDDEVSRRLRLIIHDAAEERVSSDVDCRADLKFLAGAFCHLFALPSTPPPPISPIASCHQRDNMTTKHDSKAARNAL